MITKTNNPAKISHTVKRNNVAWYKGRLLSWRVFSEHVIKVRKQLLKNILNDPSVQAPLKIINLCQDKYHFLVLFTACLLEGLTTVMPSNQSAGELARVKNSCKNIQLIDDHDIEKICTGISASTSSNIKFLLSAIPHSMIVAEVYSSGSSGIPTANLKTWGQLIDGAQQVYSRLGLDLLEQVNIIATVPPQHMFGFETCIVLALVCGVTIHHQQPFYALDIQRALLEMPSPRMMVTTPIHLKACNVLTLDWPKIEFVLSATAPMQKMTAQQSEAIMDTKVKEIYGCSETGAIATRRMLKDPRWKLLADYSIEMIKEISYLRIPAIRKRIALPDKLEMLSENYFKLVSRNSDLIKIGGKRNSLQEITLTIKSLKGVKDAVVFQPRQKGYHRARLAALIIAPEVTSEQLREELLELIDPVFLPRPLGVITQLPYNSTGKLPYKELLNCLDDYLNGVQSC